MSTSPSWDEPQRERGGVERLLNTAFWTAASLGGFVAAVMWAYNLGVRSPEEIPALGDTQTAYAETARPGLAGRQVDGQGNGAHNRFGDDSDRPDPDARLAEATQRPTDGDIDVVRERISESEMLALVEESANAPSAADRTRIVGLPDFPLEDGADDAIPSADGAPASRSQNGAARSGSEQQGGAEQAVVGDGGLGIETPSVDTQPLDTPLSEPNETLAEGAAEGEQVALLDGGPIAGGRTGGGVSIEGAAPNEASAAAPQTALSGSDAQRQGDGANLDGSAPQAGAPLPGTPLAGAPLPGAPLSQAPSAPVAALAPTRRPGSAVALAPAGGGFGAQGAQPTSPQTDADASSAGRLLRPNDGGRRLGTVGGGASADGIVDRSNSPPSATVGAEPLLAPAPSGGGAQQAERTPQPQTTAPQQTSPNTVPTQEQRAQTAPQGSGGGLFGGAAQDGATTRVGDGATVGGGGGGLIVGGPPAPTPTPEPTPQRPPQSAPIAPQGSGYAVQLAALESPNAVRERWRIYQARQPDLLSGRELILEPVTVSDQATGGSRELFRLRVAAASRAEAIRLCDNLRRRGLTCFVASQ